MKTFEEMSELVEEYARISQLRGALKAHKLECEQVNGFVGEDVQALEAEVIASLNNTQSTIEQALAETFQHQN